MQEKYEINKKRLKTALAQIVKKYRVEQGKSISKISAEILMTKSMWQKLETGEKDPQYTTIWRVAEALGVTVEKLSLEIKEILGDDFSISEL